MSDIVGGEELLIVPTTDCANSRNLTAKAPPINATYSVPDMPNNKPWVYRVVSKSHWDSAKVLNWTRVSHNIWEYRLSPLTEKRTDYFVVEEFPAPGVEDPLDYRVGTDTQAPIRGFDGEVITEAHDYKLESDSIYWYSFPNNDSEETPSEVAIRFTSNALYAVDKNSGSIKNYSVTISVYGRTADMTETVLGTFTLSNNTQDEVIYDWTKNLTNKTGEAYIAIGVLRETPNSASLYVQDDVFISTITTKYSKHFSYPGTALLALTLEANDSMNGSAPNIEVMVRGRKINVPSNYNLNPDTQIATYSGAWDGTFKKAYSTNPAWILYDLWTDKEIGLGDVLNPDLIDKWAFYKIGRYCDEPVAYTDPAGTTTYSPRFAFNGVIDGQQSALDLSRTIGQIFRGIIQYANGSMILKQEAPAQPTNYFNMGNIIKDSFSITTIPTKGIYNTVEVSYLDKNKQYKPRKLVVKDYNALKYQPERKRVINAIGITNEGQAYRQARYVLQQSILTKTYTFSTNLEGFNSLKGDVVYLQHDMPQYQYGGKILDVTSNIVKIDTVVPFDSNSTYVFNVPVIDQTVYDEKITDGYTVVEAERAAWTFKTYNVTNVIGDEVYLDSAITTQIGESWAYGDASSFMAKVRIIGLKQNKDQTITITACQYDEDMYTIYDNMEEFKNHIEFDDAEVYSPFDSPPIPVIKVTEQLILRGNHYDADLFVNTYISDARYPYLDRIETQFKKSTETKWQPLEVTTFTADVGSKYDFRARAISTYNKVGEWINAQILVIGDITPPAMVTGFNLIQNSRALEFRWDKVADLDIDYYQIRYGKISNMPNTQPPSWGNSMILGHTDTNSFVTQDLSYGEYYFFIKAKDTSGNWSENATAIRFNYVKDYLADKVFKFPVAIDDITVDIITDGKVPSVARNLLDTGYTFYVINNRDAVVITESIDLGDITSQESGVPTLPVANLKASIETEAVASNEQLDEVVDEYGNPAKLDLARPLSYKVDNTDDTVPLELYISEQFSDTVDAFDYVPFNKTTDSRNSNLTYTGTVAEYDFNSMSIGAKVDFAHYASYSATLPIEFSIRVWFKMYEVTDSAILLRLSDGTNWLNLLYDKSLLVLRASNGDDLNIPLAYTSATDNTVINPICINIVQTATMRYLRYYSEGDYNTAYEEYAPVSSTGFTTIELGRGVYI